MVCLLKDVLVFDSYDKEGSRAFIGLSVSLIGVSKGRCVSERGTILVSGNSIFSAGLFSVGNSLSVSLIICFGGGVASVGGDYLRPVLVYCDRGGGCCRFSVVSKGTVVSSTDGSSFDLLFRGYRFNRGGCVSNDFSIYLMSSVPAPDCVTI